MNQFNNSQSINPNDVNLNRKMVDEDLFIEREEPLQSKDNAIEEKSVLIRFLDRDFKGEGYRDGYQYANADVMDNNMRTIRNDFLLTVDQMIEEYQLIIDRLQIHAVEVRCISVKTEEKVNLRIESVRKTIERLEEQKTFSVIGEGLVMKAINAYRDGFIRGVNDNNEELLVMSYKGLF